MKSEIIPRRPFYRKWWFWLIIIIIIASALFLTKLNKAGVTSLSLKPKCPADLNGVLTYQLVDMSKISSMLPLGNLNPPGHTSPVDHIYFNTLTAEKISLYAPADSWITNILEVKQDTGSGYQLDTFLVQFTPCEGLKLDFAGYTELNQSLMNEISGQNDKCKGDIVKEGHEGKQQQCNHDLNIKVKSGDLIGYTQAKIKEGRYDLPLEIWAANYNVDPPSNIDWSFYDEDRYAHIMCPFDLYTGDLKNTFYAKLGGEIYQSTKDVDGKEVKNQRGTFKARTIAPICGTVNQNIVGTIQGMWFGEGWRNRKDKDKVDDARQFAFLHNNVDPKLAEIGNAGEITADVPGQIQFMPQHSGTVDREPSEVKSDGKIYCYNYSAAEKDEASEGKVLAQLVDDRHLKLEYLTGKCTSNEFFSKPYNYER